MNKVIASLLSITLVALNTVSAYSQVPLKGAKGFRAASKVKVTLPVSSFSVKIPAAAAVNTAKLGSTLARLDTQARVSQHLTAPQIRQRVQAGHLQDISARILAYPQAAERAALLREDFAQAALGQHIPDEQLAQALTFWRTDLANVSPQTVQNALADAAAIGLFGSKQDAALLTALYRKAANSELEGVAACVVAKALLKLQAYDSFAPFIKEVKTQTAVAGAVEYAREMGLSVPSVEGQAQQTPYNLKNAGKITLLAANPTKQAVAEYVALTPQKAPVSGTQAQNLAPAFSQVELPALDLPMPSLAVAQAETFAQSDAASAPLTAYQRGAKKALQARRAAAQQTSSVSFLGHSQNTDDKNALYGGLPVPALWKTAKKLAGGVKKLFTKKTAAQAALPAQPQASTFVQRASLYLSSFVVGLEVATPVIANFGTSFGLSLEDNILVAAATYFPYSVGSFLSNWLKEKIGRKASLNVGLGLLGAGFTAGVALLGLNGNFVPWQDAMAHFYSILGCIMAASTGGVFVHNAIGPMMTEISAGESELVRQKRNANTELGRAMGMAASFAFPFIATKLLAQDWSFTFAMPIPLVAAAALGLNLAKIPNSKPQVAAPQAKAGSEAKTGKWAALKNNAYVNLFKEEKGVAALLTGLFVMNAVETCFSNGFLFLLPGLTNDPSAQYLFGLAQFAAPFLLGRYLAGNFLKWFPKHNMSIATLLSAVGGIAALPLANDAYALTAALFAAEVGISTAFTLAFARTAKNTHTQDRVISLIVASAVSCALGPMLFSNLAQNLMDAGIFSSAGATTAALIGVPSVLALLSAGLFLKLERNQAGTALNTATGKNTSPNWLKKIANYFGGKKK